MHYSTIQNFVKVIALEEQVVMSNVIQRNYRENLTVAFKFSWKYHVGPYYMYMFWSKI